MSPSTFAELLTHPDVAEECVLRGRLGFMAFHGGGLEELTDVIARTCAEQCDASYYAVLQPASLKIHIPSRNVSPEQSAVLAGFIDHVDVVITVHGFGRKNLFLSLLLGGQNRDLATHIAAHLRPALPDYTIVDNLDDIPIDLRGVHSRNPVNLPLYNGVQIELPPRVRGSSPVWADWDEGLVPHTVALIGALSAAAKSFEMPNPALG